MNLILLLIADEPYLSFIQVFVAVVVLRAHEHGAIEHLPQAHRAQNSKASTCRSECKDPSQQAKLSRASISASICPTCCVNKNEEIEICPAYKGCFFGLLTVLVGALGILKSPGYIYIRGPLLHFLHTFFSSLSASVAGGGRCPRSEALGILHLKQLLRF